MQGHSLELLQNEIERFRANVLPYYKRQDTPSSILSTIATDLMAKQLASQIEWRLAINRTFGEFLEQYNRHDFTG